MKIVSVEIALCPLPLKQPVHMGSVVMKTRDYVAVRIATDSGIEGFALSYRSGTSLLDAAAMVATHLIGRDPLMSREFTKFCEASMVPARAAMVRAVSLFEVALWDIACKAADLPLYRMLGGLRRSVPAIAVAGFSYETRDHSEIEDELDRHIDEGLQQVKLLIKGNDFRANAAYLERMARHADGRIRISVDAHWSWRYLAEALETCRLIDGLGLGFIEDPFLPQQWRLTAELRSKLNTPLAMGEDVTDAFSFLEVVNSTDILRVDATASGGISAAMAVLDVASISGRQVIPHVFPYLHLHLACAHPSIAAVEYIPGRTDADPVGVLLTDFPTIRAGEFIVSDRPGNGVCLDWESVVRHSAAQRKAAA